MSADGSMQGSTEILPLPDLLQNLCDGRRTGTLVLQGERTLLLYMRSGTLAAGFDGDPEFLAKALVKSRLLTWEELDEFREFFRPTPPTLERLLLEQGRVDAEGLRHAHQFVIREVLCEALSWSEAHPVFREGPPLPQLVRVNLPHEGVGVSTKPALMEGVYQLDEWTEIRAHLISFQDVAKRVATGPTAEGEKGELEAIVDGMRSVEELIALARVGRFEAACLLKELARDEAIRFLNEEELLALAKRVRSGASDQAAVREKLIGIYERAEELGFQSPEISLWLAQALEARGELEAASDRYLRLGRQLAKSPETVVESTEIIRRALRLRPDDGSLQRELILSLIRQERMEDAAIQAEVYVQWLRSQGDPLDSLKKAGEVLKQLEEFEEMLVLQAELAAEAGNRAQALALYRRIAEIRIESDEFELEEKAEALERILQLSPSDLDARYDLAQLLSDDDPERATAEIKVFIEAFKDSEATPSDGERLVGAYKMWARLDAKADVAGALALAHLDCDEISEAERILRKALEVEGEVRRSLIPAFKRLFARAQNASNHFMLCQVLLRSGQAKRGVGELRVLGARAAKSGNKPLALRAYRTAIKHNPFDRGNRLALASLLKDGEDSAARLENLRALAHVAAVEGKLDLQIDVLEDYVREATRDLGAARELADCHVKQGGPRALDGLRRFAKASVRKENAGDVAWAREQAKRLGAKPTWFEGL